MDNSASKKTAVFTTKLGSLEIMFTWILELELAEVFPNNVTSSQTVGKFVEDNSWILQF